jgi:hypothetical protein
MSALATIFGSLGELSESELRQLYLAIGVRLGIPDVPTGAKPQGKKSGKTGSAKTKAAKGQPSSTSSKGNPKRKSQWANHPLYQEYNRLKKAVEAQSKEQKCSFNAVDTAESRAYREAFTRWVDAKHSFRGHGESGQLWAKPNGNESEQSSEEEEEDEKPEKPAPRPKPAGAAGPSQEQSKTVPPGKTSPTPSGKSGSASGSHSGKGKSASK